MDRWAYFAFGLVGVLYVVYAVATPGSQFLAAMFGGALSGFGFTAWWEHR